MNDIKSNLKTVTMNITPAIAKEWLRKNKLNRNVRKNKVNQYKRDMQNGNWYTTHQGIAFFEDGDLCDGQHRLLAIVESGVSVDMQVSFGLERSSAPLVDETSRAVLDRIKIGNLSDWIERKHIAIIKMLMPSQTKTYSVNEITDFGNKHKDSIIFSANSIKSNRKYLSGASIYSAIAKAFYYESQDNLTRFANIYMSGIIDTHDDIAALRLREYLLQNGAQTMRGYSARKETELKAQRAIQAFCNKEQISRLHKPTVEIYKITD